MSNPRGKSPVTPRRSTARTRPETRAHREHTEPDSRFSAKKCHIGVHVANRMHNSVFHGHRCAGHRVEPRDLHDEPSTLQPSTEGCPPAEMGRKLVRHAYGREHVVLLPGAGGFARSLERLVQERESEEIPHHGRARPSGKGSPAIVPRSYAPETYGLPGIRGDAHRTVFSPRLTEILDARASMG
jgi:hypothetical protein